MNVFTQLYYSFWHIYIVFKNRYKHFWLILFLLFTSGVFVNCKCKYRLDWCKNNYSKFFETQFKHLLKYAKTCIFIIKEYRVNHPHHRCSIPYPWGRFQFKMATVEFREMSVKKGYRKNELLMGGWPYRLFQNVSEQCCNILEPSITFWKILTF